MKNRRLVLLIFFLALCASGHCAVDEESALFWPAPPAEIRIVFVKSIYAAEDIGAKPGLFKKLRQIIAGREKDAFSKPIAVAVDAKQTLYICDPGRQALYIFSQKEKKYKKINSVKEEELLSPVGVAVSEQGDIFLADSGLKKVFCLDKEGKFKFLIGENKFLRPTGLAIKADKLYIVDTAAHSVLVYSLKGNFLSRFGARGKAEGEFNYPSAVSVDSAGRIYVVDTLNCRIQVFNQDAKFLYSIGQAGDSSGSFSRPKAVAVDSFGHIYSTDGLFDNLQIFNQKKEFLLSLGESGHKDGEFWMPCGIAIDSANFIYVADSYNRRIQVFQYVGKD